MVAVADDGVVDVFKETATLIVPATLVVQQFEVPEDALGILRERRVQLIVGQCHIVDLRFFNFIELDQHHGRVDAVLDTASVDTLVGVVDVEAAIAGRQDVG